MFCFNVFIPKFSFGGIKNTAFSNLLFSFTPIDNILNIYQNYKFNNFSIIPINYPFSKAGSEQKRNRTSLATHYNFNTDKLKAKRKSNCTREKKNPVVENLWIYIPGQ